MNKIGTLQKKILLTLLGGVALGLSRSPNQYFRTLRQIRKDWQSIEQQNFNRSVRNLSAKKLVEETIYSDDSFSLALTKEGKRQARMFSLLEGSMNFKKPKIWDKKWRIVVFDIPETDRAFRDILRCHLRDLKFIKLQNSVFVSPHPFEKIILKVVKIYSAEKYVRVITALTIDNEKSIKARFKKMNCL